uniref:Adrenomedullin 2 n=1 Tax=Chrysemys picta bellii TaxID=8478 RepID=A0A8C3HY62_CHRPI
GQRISPMARQCAAGRATRSPCETGRALGTWDMPLGPAENERPGRSQPRPLLSSLQATLPQPLGGAKGRAQHSLTGPWRAKRHAAPRRHHAHLMRVGCVLGTCQVQNLGHRLWQLMGQSGRQDSSPMNPNSPHSYG